MTDFRTLTDAFAELERRADAASGSAQADTATHTPVRARSRLMLVAASVVAVVAVATGATLLERGAAPDTNAAAPPTASHTAPVRSHEATSIPSPTISRIPETPAQLARRFRTVLDGSATFTVTDTGAPVQMSLPAASAPVSPAGPVPMPSAAKNNGAAIVGTLTASGITGGFDLQIFRASPGDKASCDDPDRSKCTVRRLTDGSSLAVGREPLHGSSHGVTYQANLIRRDGVEFLMHLSNERDPKGESTVLAARPPLTTDQMTAILASHRW